MSKADAKKFIDHVQKDQALHTKVTQASEHVIAVAKEHGYNLTRKDLRAALRERWSQQHEDDDDTAHFPFSEAPGF